MYLSVVAEKLWRNPNGHEEEFIGMLRDILDPVGFYRGVGGRLHFESGNYGSYDTPETAVKIRSLSNQIRSCAQECGYNVAITLRPSQPSPLYSNGH